jgi:hypothetical protein
MDSNALVSRLHLLPADEGVDVVPIRPTNYGPLGRGSVRWSGNGLMLTPGLQATRRRLVSGTDLEAWVGDNVNILRLFDLCAWRG